MPKSKRSQDVALTRVAKKGRQGKEKLFQAVQDAYKKFRFVWVFKVVNMRNNILKEIREDWKHSRIIFGKKKVMANALSLSLIAEKLVGESGILFTNQQSQDVRAYFENFSRQEFARAGVESQIEFMLNKGTLMSLGGRIPIQDDLPVKAYMEPQLRKLGLPTEVKDGVVCLLKDYKVCSIGDVLDHSKAQLLKLFGLQSCNFTVELLAMYDKGTIVD